MDQKDEIKTRLDLVEVIREYVQLKAVGVNFQARCPFHNEKTPSFIVSSERQIWKCFGCGKGGDVFSFVMEIEGLSFIEALRQLAPKAGVVLQRQNTGEISRRNRLLDCLEYAGHYFHEILIKGDEAHSAREYLSQRSLSADIISEFKIGYSLDSWDSLYNALRNQGFNDNEIFLAGLTVKKDKGLGYYDRFRGRIMFPIHNVSGNLVAFTARVRPEREKEERQGKYINSPQSPVYDKSKILFGLYKAKQAIRSEDAAIVVEGQMDMITSYQAGIKNVVASSGTALSSDQIKLLKRYTGNVLFSFDMDAAGQMAAQRGIIQALQADVNIKVIQVPGGKDPDECIRHDFDSWKKAVQKAQNIMDYYFEKTFAGINLSDMAQKKQAAAKILNVVVNISSPIEQDTWIRRLSDVLMVQEESLRDILQKGRVKQGVVNKQARSMTSENVLVVRDQVLAESLLALALKFFHYFDLILNTITPEMFEYEKHRVFYKMLVFYYNNNTYQREVFNNEHFKYWLKNNIKDEQDLISLSNLVDMLLLLADKDFYDVQETVVKREIQRIMMQLKKKYLSNKLMQIERQLTTAEQNKDQANITVLMDSLHKILIDLKSLNQ